MVLTPHSTVVIIEHGAQVRQEQSSVSIVYNSILFEDFFIPRVHYAIIKR